MQLRHPTLETFWLRTNINFFPVFYFYTLWKRIFSASIRARFGQYPSDRTSSISWLVYILINKLTKNNLLSLLASVLVSFNKSYFDGSLLANDSVTGHFIDDLVAFGAIVISRIKTHKLSLNKLAKFITLILLAGLSFGFGIGVGFYLQHSRLVIYPEQIAPTSDDIQSDCRCLPPH